MNEPTPIRPTGTPQRRGGGSLFLWIFVVVEAIGIAVFVIWKLFFTT